MRARLSVVMAVYNGERYLRESLDRVLGQTFTDFEFVIVEDGSTDQTPSIVAEYERADPRIVVVSQSNTGIATSLNRGIAAAENDLVAHIDQDDNALPTWLEKQLAFLDQHPECSVVSSYCYFIGTNGKRLGKSQNAVDVERGRKEFNPSLFLEVVHSTVLMRKADILAVGGYRKGYFGAEDRDLWGRIVTSGRMIRCNPEPLVEYRLHGASATTFKLNRTDLWGRRGIDMNVVRRMQGLEELTAEQVEQWYKDRSFGEKVTEYRRVASGFHYKNATRSYSEKRWLNFLWSFGAATMFRPVFVLSRAFKKVGA